jgi:hypothetical protein
MRFPQGFHAILAAASLSLLLFAPVCRAGDPDCSNGTEVIETGDYFLEVESAAGAVGDVVGVAVKLHSRLENPGWIALGLALCHDPEVAEDADTPFPQVGHGSLIDINFMRDAFNARFPSDEPMQLFTRYYRIKGEPGQVGAVTFCDGVLERAMRLCTYNYFHIYTGPGGGRDFLSTANVGGALTVLEGPATHPDPPPEPALAIVYDDLPGDEEVNFRVRIEGGVVSPGDTGVPIDVYASAAIEYTGLLLPVDFDERYLRLARVERYIQPGTSLIDNRDRIPGAGPDEGHAVVTNITGLNSYRLAAEGEEVHVATLFFDVLESAAEVEETALDVVTVSNYLDIVYEPAIVFRHRGGLDVTQPPVEASVEPLQVTRGLIRIVQDRRAFIRGDANGDGTVDLSDPQFTLNNLFLGGPRPACPDAADANDDGKVQISDPIATLMFLFLGNPSALPAPHGAPGEDPTPDDGLGCRGG